MALKIYVREKDAQTCQYRNIRLQSHIFAKKIPQCISPPKCYHHFHRIWATSCVADTITEIILKFPFAITLLPLRIFYPLV